MHNILTRNYTIPIILVAICCAIAGGIGHVWFWLDIGEFSRYDNAHDESFYFESIRDLQQGMFYSTWWFRQLFYKILFENPTLLAFLNDIVWPLVLVGCTAFLGIQISKNSLAVLLFVIFFVFGIDILSLNSTLLPKQWAISFNMTATSQFKQYIVAPFLTYIHILRSPEPQASLPFLTIHIALLIMLVKNVDSRTRITITLIFTTIISASSYSFYAATTLILTGAVCFSLACIKKWKLSGLVFIFLILGIAVFYLVTFSKGDQFEATTVNSHLPALSLSIFYVFIVITTTLIFLKVRHNGIVFFWKGSNEVNRFLMAFGFCCALFPVLTLNQQVVTGQMVLLSHWEKLINYSVLSLSVLLLYTSIHHTDESIDNVKNKFPVKIIVVLLFFVLFLAISVNRQYQYWAYANIQSYAYAKALNNTVNKMQWDTQTKNIKLVLDRVTRDQLVRIRTSLKNLETLGYSAVVSSNVYVPKEKLSFADNPSDINLTGFEQAARLGLSAGDLKGSLEQSIRKQDCWPYLGYFVAILDCSPVLSSYRKSAKDFNDTLVGNIVQGYRAYLQGDNLASEINNSNQKQETIVLRFTPFESGTEYWDEKLLHIEELEYSKTRMKLGKRFWPEKTFVYLQANKH